MGNGSRCARRKSQISQRAKGFGRHTAVSARGGGLLGVYLEGWGMGRGWHADTTAGRMEEGTQMGRGKSQSLNDRGALSRDSSGRNKMGEKGEGDARSDDFYGSG